MTTAERTPLPSSAYSEANRDALLADAAASLFDQDPCFFVAALLSRPTSGVPTDVQSVVYGPRC